VFTLTARLLLSRIFRFIYYLPRPTYHHRISVSVCLCLSDALFFCAIFLVSLCLCACFRDGMGFALPFCLVRGNNRFARTRTCQLHALSCWHIFSARLFELGWSRAICEVRYICALSYVTSSSFLYYLSYACLGACSMLSVFTRTACLYIFLSCLGVFVVWRCVYTHSTFAFVSNISFYLQARRRPITLPTYLTTHIHTSSTVTYYLHWMNGNKYSKSRTRPINMQFMQTHNYSFSVPSHSYNPAILYHYDLTIFRFEPASRLEYQPWCKIL
jgi:hypothetical protein